MSYILEVQEDENGDQYITLPPEVIEDLCWQEGDILNWDVRGTGIVLSRVNDSAGYEVIEEQNNFKRKVSKMSQGFYGGYMGNAGAMDDLVYRGQPNQMMPMPYYGGGMGIEQLAGFAGPAQLSTDVIKANIPMGQMAGSPSFDINRRPGAMGGRSGEQLKRIYEGGTKGNEQLNEELRRRGIMPGGPQLPMAMGMGVPAGFQNKFVS